MWKNIEINIQNIETDTGKSVLIKMPNKSKYAGYKLWHPSKLVRKGSNSYAVSVGYTNEFTFKLKKFGNGKYNKFDVIDEIEISAEEFEKQFECMEDCTKEKSKETYLIVEEPEKIEKEISIEECLKNEGEINMKIFNRKEVEKNIKNGEVVYVGYFNYTGKETVRNGMMRLPVDSFNSISKSWDTEFYKVKDGYATKLAYSVLKDECK